ncbi:MAG: chorismate mutase [Candidatus Methanofastidiosia archaeon]
MKELRERIDEIDIRILRLLEERMTVVDEIAEIKKSNNLEIEDREREEEIVKNKKSRILKKEEIEKIFNKIIEVSKEREVRL